VLEGVFRFGKGRLLVHKLRRPQVRQLPQQFLFRLRRQPG